MPFNNSISKYDWQYLVTGIFLSDDYLSVNKDANSDWEDLKHIIISYINDFYDQGMVCCKVNKNFHDLLG